MYNSPIIDQHKISDNAELASQVRAEITHNQSRSSRRHEECDVVQFLGEQIHRCHCLSKRGGALVVLLFRVHDGLKYIMKYDLWSF